MRRGGKYGGGLALAASVLVLAWNAWQDGSLGDFGGVGVGASGEIERLYAGQVSGEVVEASGRVKTLLADDRKGSRHQRFIVALASGHTVLVSHNIDLAPRLDALERGDSVSFRGQYEWNERGGVVHWTHHDPRKRRPGGWVEHAGRKYR